MPDDLQVKQPHDKNSHDDKSQNGECSRAAAFFQIELHSFVYSPT
jgi:hypothetical protein